MGMVLCGCTWFVVVPKIIGFEKLQQCSTNHIIAITSPNCQELIIQRRRECGTVRKHLQRIMHLKYNGHYAKKAHIG